MKATKVYYQKTFDLGNYSNEKIGVEIELDLDEKAEEALKNAKVFVHKMSSFYKDTEEYNRCMKVLANPDVHSKTDYDKAQEYVDKYDMETSSTDDLPF